MKGKHKHVIVYLPNGNEQQYCTRDLSASNIEIAEKIECEPHCVNIVTKDIDGAIEGYSFVGMPYILNIF